MAVALRKQNLQGDRNAVESSARFHQPAGRKASSANRILALLVAHPDFGEARHDWTLADLALWAEPLQSKGILRHGAKKKLQAVVGTERVTIDTLDQIFEPGALEALLEAFEGDHRSFLRWWRRNLTADMQKRIQYPCEVVMARGPKALLDAPKVIVGTIHSVKGGEADVVFLFPDLSPQGQMASRRHGPPRDAVIRTFYVGMTRAREVLYLCAPVGCAALRI
jgi:superfamily I DNA/RNA helicase